MVTAFPSRTQPPMAITDPITTQTVQSAPPTATLAMTVVTAANCLDCGKPQRPASPSFTMNAITESHPGAIVNMVNDGNTNSFITQTLATNCQNCPDNQNTIAFNNNIPEADKWINARVAEIANQGPSETTATNRHDCPVPDRCQFTNHREHQISEYVHKSK